MVVVAVGGSLPRWPSSPRSRWPVSTAARGASVVRDAPSRSPRPCGTDEFDGTTLDDVRWDVLRPAAPGSPSTAAS